MCFDCETEEQIYQLWEELAESGLSTYHVDKNGSRKRPHITLAGYDELDVNHYAKSLKAFLEQRKPFDIHLSTIGTFLNSDALFLNPVMTKEFYQFHQDYHNVFASFQDNDLSFYLPDRWIPHCTIANHIGHDNLLKAFHHISQSFRPIKAKVSEIALIKLIYKNGFITGSETLITQKFLF